MTPKPIFGNLLTLPIDDSFMYVQPLYTRRDSESAFPVLSFVLVSYKGRVGIGETLREAIEDSLDGVVSTPDPDDAGDADRDAERLALGVAVGLARRPRARVARRPRSATCSARPRRSSPRPTPRRRPATR